MIYSKRRELAAQVHKHMQSWPAGNPSKAQIHNVISALEQIGYLMDPPKVDPIKAARSFGEAVEKCKDLGVNFG